jgi:O-antigen/teichoic acid export membrane protein
VSERKLKVIALSLGQGLARIIGLLVMMLMARLLIKEDLAAYRQTMLAYLAVGPILSLGVGQGMYYFLPSETERVRGRVMDGIAALGLMGILFALFIALGGNELLARKFSNPQVSRLLMWMIPYAIITIPATAAESVLVARDRVMLASVFGVARQLFIGIATLIPLLFWQTADSPLIGNVVASVLMGLTGIGLMLRSASGGSPYPSFAGIKELLWFTVPLAVGGMFGTLSKQLDQLIVSFMCPPDEFAVYTLGAMELPLIGIVTGALTSVTLADMRKSIVDGKSEEALRLFRTVGEKSSLIMLPIMVFFLITGSTFIQYLYTSEYADSSIPFRIYLTLLPLRTVVFGSLLVALGLTRFIMWRCLVGLLVNLVLSTLLVYNYGPWGAVIATVATMYFWEVPACLYKLSTTFDKSWTEIFPVAAMAQILVDLIPLTIVSFLLVWLVDNIHLEFALVTICFAAFLFFYWNNKLYTMEDIKSKLASLQSKR